MQVKNPDVQIERAATHALQLDADYDAAATHLRQLEAEMAETADTLEPAAFAALEARIHQQRLRGEKLFHDKAQAHALLDDLRSEQVARIQAEQAKATYDGAQFTVDSIKSEINSLHAQQMRLSSTLSERDRDFQIALSNLEAARKQLPTGEHHAA
jgi:chromosome segregation ATPase